MRNPVERADGGGVRPGHTCMKGPNGDGTVHAVRTQTRFAFASNGVGKMENGESWCVQLNAVVPPADR